MKAWISWKDGQIDSFPDVKTHFWLEDNVGGKSRIVTPPILTIITKNDGKFYTHHINMDAVKYVAISD